MRLHLARRWLIVTIATAGLVLVVVAVALVAGIPRRRSTPPTVPASVGSTASTTPQTGTLVASVPVFYVGGGRLFREYHDLKVSPDTVPGRVAAAVTEMVRGGSAADPDYATLWPDGIAVREVRIDGGIATVNLSGTGPGPRLPSPSPFPSPSSSMLPVAQPAHGRLAVQQLVWTVSAAVADTPVGHVDGVVLLVDGAAVGSLWGLVETGGVLRAEPPAGILAPLWLVEPHEGATLGKTFTAHVTGTVFEATLRLRVRVADGDVVKNETMTLDRRGEATLQVTLPPGRYVVEAFMANGGVEGLDDHTITVK